MAHTVRGIPTHRLCPAVNGIVACRGRVCGSEKVNLQVRPELSGVNGPSAFPRECRDLIASRMSAQ
eukprot:11569993-Prorocentrum_lima.AAC.1